MKRREINGIWKASKLARFHVGVDVWHRRPSEGFTSKGNPPTPTDRPSDDRLMFLKSVLHSTWTLIWHNDEMSSLSFVGDSCQQVSMYCVVDLWVTPKIPKPVMILSVVTKTTALLDSVLSSPVSPNYPVFERPWLSFLSNERETSICRLGASHWSLY